MTSSLVSITGKTCKGHALALLCIIIAMMIHIRTTDAAYPFGSVYRPFSANSPWNSRPVNAVLDDTVTVPLSSYFPAVAAGIYSTGVFVAKETDSPMTVYGPVGSGIIIADIGGSTASVTIPRWPANTLPASGSDGHCEIYDPTSNTIHSFWQLINNNGTWRGTLYGWAALDGVGWGTPAHFYLGARATGVPSSAGLIRSFEVDDGDSMYRHALTMSLTFNGLSNNPTYVFPATAADGDASSTNYGYVPEGALLMLPSTFNSTKLLATPKLRKVAETLKTYGAYVTDRNVGTPYVIYVEIGANFTLHPGGWSNTAAADLQTIRAALRPLKSCSGWLNGNNQAVTFNQNQNLLSMRGPWTLESGTNAGYFDTWKQSVVFSNRTSKTSQRNTNGTGFAKLLWGKPTAGQLYNLTAITTGGGQYRFQLVLTCLNKTNIDSGYLSNGKSYLFTWPSSYCWSTIWAVSGVNQESSVSVNMVKYEPPVAQSSGSVVTPSESNNTSNTNSTSPFGSNSTRAVNGGQSMSQSTGLFVLILMIVLSMIVSQ